MALASSSVSDSIPVLTDSGWLWCRVFGMVPDPLVVSVVDRSGNPVDGVTVFGQPRAGAASTQIPR